MGLLGIVPAHAGEPATTEAVVQWVAADGRILDIHTQTQNAWAWGPALPGGPLPKSPMLRSWIELPEGYDLGSWEGTALRVGPAVDSADGPLKGVSGKIIAVDGERAVVRATLRNSRGVGAELGLVFRAHAGAPALLLDPSCADRNIQIDRSSSSPSPHLTAVTCEDEASGTVIYFFHSPENKIKLSTFVIPQEDRGPTWFRVPVPASTSGHVPLGRLTMGPHDQDHGEDAASEYSVSYVSELTSRFNLTVGTGATYQVYTEAPLNIRVAELTWVAKVTAGYRLIPERLDVAVTAFLTLLPIVTAPSETPSARFYGVNLRSGYQLPWRWWGADWSVSAGAYLWGMLVPNNAYGLSLLAGPQIFFSMRRPVAKGSVSAYFKFAPMSDAVAFSFSNRELALGGGWQPGSRLADRLWGLTLDLADASFTSSKSINTMQLRSLSLGFTLAL